MFCLGNEKQKPKFLVVSRSYVHFGFERTYKIACLKSWVPRKKLLNPCANQMCLPDKMIPVYFTRLCKVWSILNHRSVGQVHSKNGM